MLCSFKDVSILSFVERTPSKEGLFFEDLPKSPKLKYCI